MHPIISTLCAIPVLAAVSSAQMGVFGPTGGENLINFGGSLGTTDVDGDETTTINLQAGFGHFLTDVHEVGAQLNESYSSPDGAPDTISTGLSGYYNYNFRQNPRTWFYAGPHLGLLMIDANDDDDTNLAIGIHGGIRHWLSESTAVFVEPRFTVSEFNNDDVETAEVIFGYTVAL
jgi:hypothetical protein